MLLDEVRGQPSIIRSVNRLLRVLILVLEFLFGPSSLELLRQNVALFGVVAVALFPLDFLRQLSGCWCVVQRRFKAGSGLQRRFIRGLQRESMRTEHLLFDFHYLRTFERFGAREVRVAQIDLDVFDRFLEDVLDF